MNNRTRVLIGTGLLCLVLVACTDQEEGFLSERLAPCSAEKTMFATLPFKDWADTYHAKVDAVVEAHLASLRNIGMEKLRCESNDTTGVFPPSKALSDLAKELPPWKDPQRLAALSEMHMGPVLLEFFRLYKCANLERENWLPVYVQEGRNGTINPPPGNPRDLGPFVGEEGAESLRIARELAIAQPALERTLDIVGGLDQLRAVAAETECLKRVSLDLRNRFSLMADSMSCLAKVPGKSSLRDLPELPPAP